MTNHNEEIKIEKGIPLPKSTACGRRMEQIRGMEVGDSFLDHGKSSMAVNGKWRHSFKRLKFKLAVRMVIEGTTFRVWRIK